jgi:serine/threonine protein phosphatase PrpC
MRYPVPYVRNWGRKSTRHAASCAAERRRRIVLKAVGATRRGLTRSENQDNWLVRPLAGDRLLLAVANGIGGGPGGREASALAIATLAQHAQAEPIGETFALANDRVHAQGQASHDLVGMGTTLTAAIVGDGRVLLAHVGDSRAYRIGRDGIERLTDDHSVAGEMERVGDLTAEESARHPQRHVLTRAIGPFATVRVDVRECALGPDDRLLLCTDGLYNALADEEIYQVATRGPVEMAVNALVEEALTRGGGDDITVVLAELARDRE